MPWSPSIVGSKSPCEPRTSAKQSHQDIAELRGTSRIEDIRLKLSSPSRDSVASNSSGSDRGSVSPLGQDGDTPPAMPASPPPQTTTKYVPLSERAGMLKNPNHTVSDDSRKDLSTVSDTLILTAVDR